ncbi:MAG TPA: class II fructose-bisphosphate aldolase [Candidatus Paceibacterota bacterium]|nr:class II fructose-bisphosphate aldolase [Candidatus Paceibacterota bacterium]
MDIPMKNLRATIAEFKSAGKAIGHFNFSDSNQLRAIAHAAKETDLPVIAGLSEGEREFFPITHARALIDRYRVEGINIFLNADHTYSSEKAHKAISEGVDSVVVDGAALPFEENVAMLKECVDFAHHAGRDVIIEGELGYIGQSSKQLDSLPEGVSIENLTTVEDAKRLLAGSGIDCFAPAIGNVHGMLKSAQEPRLHPDRVKEISDALQIPLVLHGASGNTEEDIAACIKAGVTIVHINTELRVAYRDSLKKSLADHPDETTPYKFLTPAVEAMQQFLMEKMRLFASA